MPEYRFITRRCNTFKRSDGVEILLLPEPYCNICAAPIKPSYGGSGICYDCYSRNTRVDLENLSRVYAASVYLSRSSGHILSEEIKKCKHDLSYVEGLAEVFEHAIKVMYSELESYDLLVYPPRGSRAAINNIKSIVENLSDRIGIPTKDIIYKKIDYRSQQGLSREARIDNIKDKIGCKEHVDGQIIVIDDTYTTGSTMLNSALALKGMGAEKVVGLVLGRATDIKHLVYVEVLEEIQNK